MSGEAEKRVEIEGPVRLEGLLAERPGKGGLAIAHPHPLYGGSMRNNVVEALVRAGEQSGLSTLRFNFRGVGASKGVHGQGLAERDDLRAALKFLSGQGLSRLFAAGYSFGAWVAATADLSGLPVEGRILISPPVGMMALSPSEVQGPPNLIVYGGRDEFCPQGPVSELARKLDPVPELVRLDGADHFYAGFEKELTRLAKGSLDRIFRGGR